MLNCQTCGACCSNPKDDKWIEVTAEDAKRIFSGFLQPGDIEPFAMKQLHSGRCIAFVGDVGGECYCSIYENRPAICRKVQPHDEICLKLRNIHNMDTNT
jgi:uncharacterized protein